MNNVEQQERLALARRMRLRGVPLEIAEDDHHFSHSPPTGLIIRQLNGGGSAEQLNPFEVGYSIRVRIVNNFSSEFWISGFGLQLPWKERNLFLLDDPADLFPPRDFYSFLRSKAIALPREHVLNHCRRHKLSRGHPLEGYLLWSGEVAIPKRYVDGSYVEAFVVIFDQYWREYVEPLSLKVDRRGRRLLTPRNTSRKNIAVQTRIAASIERIRGRETANERTDDVRKTNVPTLTLVP